MGARFSTTQMSSLVSADPSDLSRVTSFGDAVIQRETKYGRGTSNLPEFDLTSRAGRTQAAKFYTETFSRFSEGDAHVVGYNIKFDIEQLINSAQQLPEFMDNPDSRRVLQSFERRMYEEGGMIDILPMIRSSLKGQISQRMKTSLERGDEVGQRSALALESLFSGESIVRTGEVGERAAGLASLENVLESTDFLYEIARRNDPAEMAVLETLADSSASHIDVTDNAVTRLLAKRVIAGDTVGIMPEEGYDTSRISPENLRLVDRARANIAGSKAMTTTVNLADPRYLTERSLDYLINSEDMSALKRVSIEDNLGAVIGSDMSIAPDISRSTRGIVKFLHNETGSGYFFQPTSPGASPIQLPESIFQSYTKRTISDVRNLAPDAPNTSTAVISTLGINPIQQTNIEYANRFFETGRSSPISYGSVTDISTSIAQNESTFFSGMTATGNITGFTDGLSPPDSFGMGGVVRDRFQGLSQPTVQKYNKALFDAGVSSASMNTEVRSAVVSLSAITSPLGAGNQQLIRGALELEGAALSTAVSTTGGSVGPIVRSAEDIAARVGASSDLIARNMSLLSEIGIVHSKTQKVAALDETITMVPHSIMKSMKTLDDSGKEVDFLDRLMARGSNRSSSVRLSVPQRSATSPNTVNVVYGGSLGQGTSDLAKRRAKVEAESLLSALQPYKDGGAQKMIDAGLAQNEQQANRLIGRLSGDGQDLLGRTIATIEDRGIVIGSISGADESTRTIAQQVSETLSNVTGGIDNDIVARQKGLSFQVGQINEESISLAGRAPDEVISEAAQRGGEVGRELMERSSPERQVGLLQGAIRRGVDSTDDADGGFFGRLRNAVNSARPSEDISTGSIGTRRRLRDMDLSESMKILKPKVYKTALGVAAMSAGYYLARRGQKQELYEDTMEEQEYEEGPLSIREFNDLDRQVAQQTSSRRDPLVTAGVVGNLDRNKISHYKMGSDKYSNLYGG